MNISSQDFFTEYNKRYKRVLLDPAGNPVTMPKPGDTVGNVIIERELGNGAMGVVYLGKDQLGLPKALKVAIPDSGKKDLQRLQNEAKVCANLSHANIVKVFAAGYWKDVLPFFEMEYVEGTDLNKIIRQYGSVPAPFAMAVLSILCSALEYAHAQAIVIDDQNFDNMVHRDLKPANILISNKGVVKLTDFGLAKFEKMTDASVSGLILGTVPYMAPEHQKYNRVSVESDIFSLGVMFYELLTGKRPYPDGDLLTLDKTISMKEEASYPPLKNLVPKVDPQVERIVERCLHPEASKRYDSYALLQYEVNSTLENYTKARAEDIVSLFLHNNQNFNSIVGIKPRRKKFFASKHVLITLSGVVALILLGAVGFFSAKFLWVTHFAARTQTLSTKKDARDLNLPVVADSTLVNRTMKNVDGKIGQIDSSGHSRTIPGTPSKPKSINTPAEIARPRTVIKMDSAVAERPEERSFKSAVVFFKKNDFESTIDILRKIDLTSLEPVKKDSCIVMLVESYYRSENYRSAIQFANNHRISDGKYYLLLAFCQEAMGMYNEAQISFDIAIKSEFYVDRRSRKDAFLFRAKFYQRRYEQLQVEKLRGQMISAWNDFLATQCSQDNAECEEARKVIGAN